VAGGDGDGGVREMMSEIVVPEMMLERDDLSCQIWMLHRRRGVREIIPER
jgi:hypothetical protein